MIHITTLYQFIHKLMQEGATYVDLAEVEQLFKEEHI